MVKLARSIRSMLKTPTSNLPNPHLLKLHLIGATSVGKGYITKQMRLYFEVHFGLSIDAIGVGDLVRTRFEFDEAFVNKWKQVVQNGGLVGDSDICPMFEDALQCATHGFILLSEGFLRNPKQVGFADECGVMGPDSLTIILNATKSTCRERAKHRQLHKTSGSRFDEHSFDVRYGGHQDSIEQIMAACRRTRTTVKQVNADRELATVFDDVLSHTAPFLAAKNTRSQRPISIPLPATASNHAAVLA